MHAPGLAATTDLPRIARLHNAIAGGCWADSAEKTLAEEMERRWPGIKRMMGHVRRFHASSAAAAAERGVAGVVFACCGLPAPLAPHHGAQRANPRTRYAYADPDPKITLVNASTWHADPSVSACAASARDPEGLLGTPEVLALGQPLSVQLQLAAHYWPDEMARDLIARYAALLEPGSSLVLTLGSLSPSAASTEFGRYLAGISGTPVYAHDAAAVTSWLADAGLLRDGDRGAQDVRVWDREWEDPLPAPASGTALAAVGRVRLAGADGAQVPGALRRGQRLVLLGEDLLPPGLPRRLAGRAEGRQQRGAPLVDHVRRPAQAADGDDEISAPGVRAAGDEIPDLPGPGR